MKLPKHYYSWPTFIGGTVAALSLFLILILLLISTVFGIGDNYAGLFTFIILPTIMVSGLILMFVGNFLRIKKKKFEQDSDNIKFPIVNFNDPKQRSIFFITLSGLAVFTVISAMGSYQAFHYTESDQFCGLLCHKVMEPEYVAHAGSAHERVGCVECHVGAGAGWYIKSKMSGLYQVYSVIAKAYPQPIPTPLENLRPARETCEKCHWPEKFYDRKYMSHKHYIADEQNSEWDITMVMKTGPSFRGMGLENGIHWHINKDVKIEYASTSFKRDTIVYVKYTNLKTGKVKVYQDEKNPVDEAQVANLEFRTMDCLDCHNRPSHNYKSPQHFFDDAFTAGEIPNDLPDIKIAAMDILKNEFPDKDSAFRAIEQGIMGYYEMMYPELLETPTDKAKIDQAIAAIKDSFSKNVFPFMKVRSNHYPNYLGHIENNGCYRCHNDSFKNEEKEVISRDCNLCHDIKSQGTPDSLRYANDKEFLEFEHPVDIKGKWKTKLCAECHAELY